MQTRIGHLTQEGSEQLPEENGEGVARGVDTITDMECWHADNGVTTETLSRCDIHPWMSGDWRAMTCTLRVG